jgi:hypothetical protein
MLRSLRIAASIMAAAALAACSDSSDPIEPIADSAPTLAVDASAGWGFVDLLGDGADLVSIASAESSSGWDVAFFGTSVMLNGGAAGPGGVVGYCVCQNGDATDAQVQAFTAESQRAAFEAVTAAAAPATDAEWTSDALSPAITGWYSYNPTTHVVSAAAGQAYYLRAADGNAYAKLRITAITNPTRTSAGDVTLEYAIQTMKGAPMGAVQTATLTVPESGRVYFDVNSGAQTSTDWDIAFEGYTIRVNGGVSGTGQAGALVTTEPFNEIADASGAPSTVYKGDAFGGVFDAHKWYRYNVTGSDHQIWPTFDVYLIKRGSDLYKIQLINYYATDGTARHITFRYAKVAG